jgi:deazaflavin-dependent oxidoreductase (nitroreductase family)
MTTRLSSHDPARGWLRWAVRLPLWLYRAHLGWLLGHRFLRLTHRGRHSGRRYQTVLEVVRHDRATGAYVVASGWGKKADWLRNIMHNPAVVVDAAGRHFEATAERLSQEEAEQELCDYARRHRLVFAEISRLMVGQRLKGTLEDCHRLAQAVPLVVLRPRRPGSGGQRAAVGQSSHEQS